MNTVMEIGSAEAIEGLLSLVKAREPILDTTYGHGSFWRNSNRVVHGCDLDPGRAKNEVVDFTKLPYGDATFPTVIFDPPFHPNINSIELERYKGLGKNHRELKELFQTGVRECWRVTSRHLVVKCQGYINSNRPQWMPLWAIDICGEPFEWLMATRKNKRISSSWKRQASLYRNHADYLVFDKLGNYRRNDARSDGSPVPQRRLALPAVPEADS